MTNRRKDTKEKKQSANISRNDPVFKVFLQAMSFEANGTLGSSRQSIIEWFKRREVEMFSEDKSNLNEGERQSKAERNTKSFITTFYSKDNYTPDFLSGIVRKFQIFTIQNLGSETSPGSKPQIIPFASWQEFESSFTYIIEEFKRREPKLIEDYDRKFNFMPRKVDVAEIYAFYLIRIMYGAAVRSGAAFYKKTDQTIVGACESRIVHVLSKIVPEENFQSLQRFFNYQLATPRAFNINIKEVYVRNRNAVLLARNVNKNIADIILLLPVREVFCTRFIEGSLFHKELPVELICEENDLSDFHHIFLDFYSTPIEIPLRDFQKYIRAVCFSITGRILRRKVMICMLDDTRQKKDFIVRMGFYPIAFKRVSDDILDNLSNPIDSEYQLYGKHLDEFESDII